MALTKKDIRLSYPIPAYNYRVTIYESDFIAGSEAVTLGFSEVSGLNLAYDHVVYRHGLSFLSGFNIVRGMLNPVQITMKRGMIRNNNGDFLYRWLAAEDKFLLLKNLTKDIVIDLCDETGVASVRWLVRGAVPLKMTMPDFRADDNEVAIETLEVIAHSVKVNYSL